MTDEAKREEEQTQDAVDRASEFEMAIMLLLLGKIRKVMENDTPKARAEALNDIRKSIKKETTKFLTDEKRIVKDNLQAVGEKAYKSLDSRSKKLVKPSALTSKHAEEACDYFKKYMKTSGTNYALNKNTNIYQFFTTFIEQNVKDVVDGVTTVDDAVSKAIDTLSANGIKVIDYKSGISRNVDVFVRQQMQYAAKESVQDLREENAKKDGVTIWEFDAHANARPSHQKWQGKRYDTTGKEYPTLEQLTHGEHKDYGCNHHAFPVYNKEDPYMYTKEELKNINTKPFEWNGKMYEGYEAKQKMRQQERTIKEYKRRVHLLESQGLDATKAKFLLKKHSAEYTSFCKAFGTYRRSNRLKIS